VEAGKASGALFVHPFDDYLVMAGQGTIGLEILEEMADVANILVPIGGGGLIAGVATAIKETHPHVRIIGVEATAAPGMHNSINKGKVVETPLSVSLADGIAVKKVGSNTFPIVQSLVDEIVLVGEEDISLAIVSLLERTKLLVEGAGAVPLAALMAGAVKNISGKTVCLLSGGNIDVKTISVVVERGLVAAGRYLKLKIELDDVPGALAKLAAEIATVRANISIITHDRRSKSLPIGKTEVLIELETRGYEHISEVVNYLQECDYKVETLA
jgi:threonine dehydratase